VTRAVRAKARPLLGTRAARPHERVFQRENEVLLMFSVASSKRQLARLSGLAGAPPAFPAQGLMSRFTLISKANEERNHLSSFAFSFNL